MKQIRAIALIFIIFLWLPALSYAQVTTVTKTAEKITASAAKTLKAPEDVVEEEVDETLEAKQLRIGESLDVLITRLETIYERTDDAVDLVAKKKNLDVTSAVAEITKAEEELKSARKNLDNFNAVIVDEEKNYRATTQLKDAAKKVEVDLKEARNHLILTLAALKASLSAN